LESNNKTYQAKQKTFNPHFIFSPFPRLCRIAVDAQLVGSLMLVTSLKKLPDQENTRSHEVSAAYMIMRTANVASAVWVAWSD